MFALFNFFLGFLTEFSHLICPFDILQTNSFYRARELLTTRDVCSRPKLFSRVVFAARVPPLSLSRTLSSEREREREREITRSKSPRHPSIERLFFRSFALKKDTNTGCFLHQKKKEVFKSSLNARAKILAHKKHARARFKKNDNNKSAEQRERES